MFNCSSVFCSIPLRRPRQWRAVRFRGFLSLLCLLAATTLPAHAGEAVAMKLDVHALSGAALADARVRHLLGPGEVSVVSVDRQIDKAEASAYLDGKLDKPPVARATVLLWNRHTRLAARALLSTPDAHLLAVEAVKASEVPLVPEEVEEALALAKASSSVQKAVGPSLAQYHLVRSGDEAGGPLVAEALPVRGTRPNDACTAGRCLDFLFRTESGYLPLRVQVNLGGKTVQVVAAARHGETH